MNYLKNLTECKNREEKNKRSDTQTHWLKKYTNHNSLVKKVSTECEDNA